MKLNCKHNNLTFLGNIYGDAINYYSTPYKIYRSVYKCNLCGKILFKEELNLHSNLNYQEVNNEK